MKQENPKYHFSFNVEPYPCRFIFFINYKDIPDITHLLKKHIKQKYKNCLLDLSKQIADYDFNSTDGQVFYSDGYILTIISNFKKDNAFLYGRLSHELLHTVFYTAKHIGIRHSDKSEEFYTYMQGHLTEKIFNKILKNGIT